MKERKKCCNPRSGGYKNSPHGFLCFLLNIFLLTHTLTCQLSGSASTFTFLFPENVSASHRDISSKYAKLLRKKSGYYREVQNVCKGRGDWQCTNQTAGIISAASQSLHPRACPGRASGWDFPCPQWKPRELQLQHRKLQECAFAFINLSDSLSSVGLAVGAECGNHYIWQSSLLPAV